MKIDYGSIEQFVRAHMLDAELSVAPLKSTRSAIKGLARGFAENGWIVVDFARPDSRFVRNKLTSPDGKIELVMTGGKVFRHPPHTEAICRRKQHTKKLLELAGVPVPQGSEFERDDWAIAAAYFTKMPLPIVVKPTDARSSQGVTVGVASVEELEEAWNHALAAGSDSSSVLLEQFVRGVELRAFVVGNDVAGVVARVQPFVVGNGVSSVDTLIGELELERGVNIRAKRFPIEVQWDFVGRQNADRATVLPVGEFLFLSPFTYPTMGASIVDVTDLVSEGIIDLARRANRAIPDLEVGGVDLLVGDVEDASTAFVLEVNTAAALDMHRYPTHGESRMVDEDIVAYFHSVYEEGAALIR